MKIGNAQNFWSGVMFVAFGTVFALFALRYDLGTAQRMGPAYFPLALGGLLAALGFFIALGGLARKSAEGKVEKFHFFEIAWVLGAVVVYALLLKPAGVLVAMVVLVVLSSYASHEFRWKEAVALSVVMAIITWTVFIYGLKLTIPVLPAFLER